MVLVVTIHIGMMVKNKILVGGAGDDKEGGDDDDDKDDNDDDVTMMYKILRYNNSVEKEEVEMGLFAPLTQKVSWSDETYEQSWTR